LSLRIGPEVLPPAFYPVSLNLVGRRCVVIGATDDREAIEIRPRCVKPTSPMRSS
jgi:hypothetical protein